jgi:subtilisin-like proprotein convertase family protein
MLLRPLQAQMEHKIIQTIVSQLSSPSRSMIHNNHNIRRDDFISISVPKVYAKGGEELRGEDEETKRKVKQIINK